MSKKKKVVLEDTFIGEDTLPKGDGKIRDEETLRKVLRAHLYSGYYVYKVYSDLFVVIFQVRWYEWSMQRKIQKAIEDVVSRLVHSIFVVFGYEVRGKYEKIRTN